MVNSAIRIGVILRNERRTMTETAGVVHGQEMLQLGDQSTAIRLETMFGGGERFAKTRFGSKLGHVTANQMEFFLQFSDLTIHGIEQVAVLQLHDLRADDS